MTNETTQNTKKKFDQNAYMNEKVPVTLHKDNGEYKDDLEVTLNGVTMVIPRGRTVMVPRKYALIVEQSMAQTAVAVDVMDKLKGRE